MAVQIGDRAYTVKVVEGRIFSDGRQYKSLVQDEAGEIWVTDRIPLHEQLDLVLRAATSLCRSEASRHHLAPVVGVAHADGELSKE